MIQGIGSALPKYRYASSFIPRNKLIQTDPSTKVISPNQIISLKKFRQRPFPRTYPALIVREDGSTYRIWSSEVPHQIIQFPLDSSEMTEIERQRIETMRTGKVKAAITEIDVSVDDD